MISKRWMMPAIAATIVTLVGFGCENTAKDGSSSSSTNVSSAEPGEIKVFSTKAAFSTDMPSRAEATRDGFTTIEDEGRYWVFRNGSKALSDFQAHGEPAKSATIIAKGPNGKSIKSVDKTTITEYMVTRPGYYSEIKDGHLWVFKSGSEALKEFKEVGEPGKSATKIKRGPGKMTVKSIDMETVKGYTYSTPYYYATLDGNRVWVFLAGSEELAEFKEHGEPGKSATKIAKGPKGETLKSENMETIRGYIMTTNNPGWTCIYDEGRLWVFKNGSSALAEFIAVGEPAKSATLIRKGPNGESLKGSNIEDLREFAATYGK